MSLNNNRQVVSNEEDVANDGPVAIDPSVVQSMFDAIGTNKLDGDGEDGGYVQYKGNYIPADDATVLTHVVDAFQDHFGGRNLPNLEFHLTSFTDLGDNPNYRAADDGPGHKFNASEEEVKRTKESESFACEIGLRPTSTDLLSKCIDQSWPQSRGRNNN